MHVPFTPILDGRFNYKQMCPRSFYQSMHKELGDLEKKKAAAERKARTHRLVERAIAQVHPHAIYSRATPRKYFFANLRGDRGRLDCRRERSWP